MLDRLEGEGRVDGAALTRVYEDVALLTQTAARFISERVGEESPGLRMASFHLRKLLFRCLCRLVDRRVTPEYREAYAAGEVDPADPADDLSEAGFFYTMEGGEQDAVNRSLVRLAERSFHRWLEDVCLDEGNRAFEVEDTPFADRETEVRRAVAREGAAEILRARDLSPFLRRPGNRDTLRVLRKLGTWFLHQYDVHHAAVMIHHAAAISRGEVEPNRVLSRHRTRNYIAALGALAAPSIAAIFAYSRWPRLFDVMGGIELLLAGAATVWFLLYRFAWRRDLTFFHTSVPRIAAGIIVGYLPIFFIDEIWGLADRSWQILVLVSALLGFATLLYLYVEVQRRIVDPNLAFARARQIFLLGVLQSFAIGLLITGLTGGYMASRNWSGGAAAVPVETLRPMLPPVIGQLPRIIGFDPFYTFPSAVFVMTFMAFFIGIFLQLLWEDIPITEPL